MQSSGTESKHKVTAQEKINKNKGYPSNQRIWQIYMVEVSQNKRKEHYPLIGMVNLRN